MEMNKNVPKSHLRGSTVLCNEVGIDFNCTPPKEEIQLKSMLRNTIDALDCSLRDKSIRPLKKGSGKLVEVRFKLIIDASEDDTVIRQLFRHNILDLRSRRFVRILLKTTKCKTWT